MRIQLSVKLLIILAIIVNTQFSSRGAIHIDSTEINNFDTIDPDSILDTISLEPTPEEMSKNNHSEAKISVNSEAESHIHESEKMTTLNNHTNYPYTTHTLLVDPIDPLLLSANPLLIDLVYKDKPHEFNWKFDPKMNEILFGKQASTLWTLTKKDKFVIPTSTQIVEQTRKHALKAVENEALDLFRMRYDQLPNAETNTIQAIKGSKKIDFNKNTTNISNNPKLIVPKAELNPWKYNAQALAQISQNSVSANWHQGGVNNFAILGIVSGDLKYNDKKRVQWDNTFEWRMGFTSISGDALRFFNTNDDVFRLSSKMGIKANGNFFYSTLLDFRTNFFDSYKAVNSTVLRSSFLTPVRFNAGLGIDYKYKGIFSLMVSPVSYKFIYVAAEDSVVKHNQFGIKPDEYVLSELGSSFRVTVSHSPTPELKFDSKFSFYTNYRSVEIDWELVCNFIINRYMSTRLSINPRFDNTIIADERVKMQYKQLLSVGFSHKFK